MASVIPCSLIENIASPSGRLGESMTLTHLFSPRPFRSLNLVCEACAMMFPPIGWSGSLANIPESGFAVICIANLSPSGTARHQEVTGDAFAPG